MPQSVLLRFKFRPGESLTYKTVVESGEGEERGSEEYKSSQSCSSEVKELVKSVSPAGTANLSLTLFAVGVSGTKRGRRSLDSGPKLKEPFNLTLSPIGEVGGRDVPVGMMGGGSRLSLDNMMATYFFQSVPVASLQVVTAFRQGV